MLVELNKREGRWVAGVEHQREFNDFAVTIPSEARGETASISCEGVKFEGDQAWVSTRWLAVEAACEEGQPAADFARMIDYARARGWYDDARDEVAAHVVFREQA